MSVGALADRLLAERLVLVTGPPGAGKSTLLASLAYDYALYALNLGEADLAQCVLCEERRLPVVFRVSGLGSLVSGPRVGVPASQRPGGLGVPSLLLVDGPERSLTVEEHGELMRWLESAPQFGEDLRIVVALRESNLPAPLAQRGVVWRCALLEAAAAVAFMEAQLGERAGWLAGALARWDLWELTHGPRLLALLCELAKTSEWTRRGALLEELLARLHDFSSPVSSVAAGEVGSGAVGPVEAGAVARQAWFQVERAWQGGGGRLLAGLTHCGAVALEPRGERTWANPVLRDYLAGLALAEEIGAGKELASLIEGSLVEWSRPLSLAQEMVGAKPALLDFLLRHPAAEAPGLAVRCARDGGIESLLVERASLLGAGRGLLPLVGALNRAGLFREARAVGEQARAREGAAPAGVLEDIDHLLAEARAGVGLPPARGNGAVVGDPDRPPSAIGFDRQRRALPADEAQARWREGQARLLELTVEWELLGAQMASEAGRGTEARRRLARASRLARLPRQWRRCGDMYDRLGRPALAFTLWGRAIQVAGEEPEGLLARSRQAEAGGRIEEACRLMSRATGIQVADPDLLVEEARLLQRAGLVLLARARLERCLWLMRDYPPALATMGELLVEDGKLDEGLGFLRRATEAAPHDPELWGRLAMRLLDAGRAREGEEALRAGLARQPARPDWLNRLGLLLLESGRHDEALGLFDAALRQAPKHPVYRYNRAIALAARATEVPGAEEEALGEFAALASRVRPARFRRGDLTPTPSLQGKGEEGGVELPREGILWDTVAAEAHRQRGLIFDRRGEFARAAEEFQRAGALVPEQPDYRLLESLAWGRLREPSRRMTLLRQAAELWPLDASVLLRLGEALEEAGEVAEALVRYRRASELEPGHGEIWLARGRAERLVGQLDAAHASLERGLGALPRDARVRKEMSLVLEETGAAEAAYEGYREAARMAVNDPSLWVCVGRLARRLDRPADSLAALRTAASLDRTGAEPHIELGLTLAQQGRYEEALGELREALARDTTRALAHYHLGVLAGRLGRGEEAESHLAYARSLGPAEGEGFSKPTLSDERGLPMAEQPASLGEMRRLLDIGEAGLARAYAEHAVRKGAVVGIALGRIMAEARERLGDLEGAQASLVAADAATPADLRWRALLLSRMGSHEKALETIRRAGRGQPWPALWRDEAGILGALGAWREAAALYDRALAEAGDVPGDERAWWLLEAGDARRRLGDLVGALDRYDRGISFGGPQAALWRRCAEVQNELGGSDEALAALRQATALDPTDHAAWFLMAELLRERGDAVRALEAVERACDAQPDSLVYALTRGRLLRFLGRGSEAVGWLRQAAQGLQDDALAWSDLGWVLLGDEDLDQAGECFAQGLAGDPGNVSCLCGLARVRQRQRRQEESLDLARQAARLAELAAPEARGADERRLALEALEACGAALEALPLRRDFALESGRAQDWLGLARAAKACGQQEEARAAVVEALRREESAGAHRLAAAVLDAEGEAAEAVAHLRRAVALEAKDPAVWVELASLLVREGHWEEVVQRWGRQIPEGSALEAGWRLAKELAVALFHLGEISQARGCLERAQRMSRSPATEGAAVRAGAVLAGWRAIVGPSEADREGGEGLVGVAIGGPGGAELLYTAGLARLAAGDQARACDELAQCVAMAPSSAVYRLGYAKSLLAISLPGEHEAELHGGPRNGAVILARQQLEALRGRGGMEFRRQVATGWVRLGDARLAATTLEAVAGETRALADEVRWAQALLRDGQYEAAGSVLRAALGRYEAGDGTREEGEGLGEEVRYLLAGALLGSGATHEAVVLLQEVIRRQPDRADAVAELGRAWERMGRYELARQAYEQALAVKPGLREAGDRLLALDAKEQLERAARSGRGGQRSWTPPNPLPRGG